ncbi:helical backbone metal receptor [Mangrovivirga sp. M17]|uniref:Helical backbone metal receptor n=1 Tax=Mangrovivirga halotolerans TaxID=2993936 RepID=A0ABT3RTQ4_9BACT|nr:helical backbone metal receptor [Mangrovivirga halotolerans]MCX2745005.1 helical backbone metal receptor [Mangrovivirga halotolerans]
MTSDTSNRKVIIDMMNRKVELNNFPVRIISLVPSQTELLCDLDLDKRVVGITKFCVHPENWLKEKEIIGGTKKLRIDKIRKLKPDLIIANKEENVKEDILTLARDFPVYISDISNLHDVNRMISDIGSLTGREQKAGDIINEIKRKSSELKSFPVKTCLYFIWKNPWMMAGSDTFINEMLNAAGYQNLSSFPRYPELTDEMKSLKPDEILLSSEPYPFKEKDFPEIKNIYPDSEIKIVDGEYFSWYGSRLTKAFDYFKKLRARS